MRAEKAAPCLYKRHGYWLARVPPTRQNALLRQGSRVSNARESTQRCESGEAAVARSMKRASGSDGAASGRRR